MHRTESTSPGARNYARPPTPNRYPRLASPMRRETELIGDRGGSALELVVEERRAWRRLKTHTVVFDSDPEFERFARDASGIVLRLFRVWLAADSVPRRYLGSLSVCSGTPFRADLRRVLRRAAEPGTASREQRRRVISALRTLDQRSSTD